MDYDAQCRGQVHCAGCLPVIFPVLLFVLQFAALRTLVKLSVILPRYSSTCLSRCCETLTSSKFSIESFSGLPSTWCTTKPLGIGPLADSQITTASGLHWFGSATFIHARLAPPLLWRVLIVTAPILYLFSSGLPVMNCPLLFRIPTV